MIGEHQFKVEGRAFGFEAEFKYLATVSDYKIKLNPALYVDNDKMEVIDEKVQKEEAKKIAANTPTTPAKMAAMSPRFSRQATCGQLAAYLKKPIH